MKKQSKRMFSRMVLKELARRYWVLVTFGSLSLFVLTTNVLGQTCLSTKIDVDAWIKAPYFACGINFIGYGQKFAVLRNAHIDIKTKHFLIPCDGVKPRYHFEEDGIIGNIVTVRKLVKGNVLNDWIQDLSIKNQSYVKRYKMSTVRSTTFVVNRIEAHNLYHAMCEWYSVFLVSYLLNFEAKQVEILFMDDRPPNLLDESWSMLFGKVLRYNTLPADNVFKTLVWNIFGYESLMNIPKVETLPYLTEFREFVLQSFGISSGKTLNCNKLSVTVILRRDYRSHPELSDGLVLRKFLNDSEVVRTVEKLFIGHNIKGIYLENYTMKQQLEIITATDILVGMHGAGMSHILFLPKHAGCFELFPEYYDHLLFFEAFSRWRGTKYVSWKNHDSRNEFTNYRTRIPDEVLVKHLNELKHSICH